VSLSPLKRPAPKLTNLNKSKSSKVFKNDYEVTTTPEKGEERKQQKRRTKVKRAKKAIDLSAIIDLLQQPQQPMTSPWMIIAIMISSICFMGSLFFL